MQEYYLSVPIFDCCYCCCSARSSKSSVALAVAAAAVAVAATAVPKPGVQDSFAAIREMHLYQPVESTAAQVVRLVAAGEMRTPTQDQVLELEWVAEALALGFARDPGIALERPSV